MIVRRAEVRDIPQIMKLLDQVNLVHHKGRPDIFKHATKYTEEQLAEIIADDNTPVFVCAEEAGRNIGEEMVENQGENAAAEEGEKVLGHGFCVLQQPKNHNILADIKTLYIDDICVDEEARGRHVGQALYNHIQEYAADLGCHNITLNVWKFNQGAFEFYKKMGLEVRNMTMEKLL